MLSDLGRREEALAATQEAVDIRRRLAQTRPDAFLPYLAMSLRSLSRTLIALEQYNEAAAAAHEGLAAILPFLEKRVSAFEDLASALRRTYLSAYEKAGTEPDQQLIARITLALKGA
jgi:hypothetical protein